MGGHHKKKQKKSQKVDQIQAQLLENLEKDLASFIIPDPVAPLPLQELKDIMFENLDKSKLEEDMNGMNEFAQFTDKVISEVEEDLVSQESYPDAQEIEFLENIKKLVIQPNAFNYHDKVMSPIGGYSMIETGFSENSVAPKLSRIEFLEAAETPFFDADSIKLSNTIEKKFNDFYDVEADDREEIEDDSKLDRSVFNLPQYDLKFYKNLEIENEKDWSDDSNDQEEEEVEYYDDDDENLELSLDQKNKLFADLGGMEAQFDINLYDETYDKNQDFLEQGAEFLNKIEMKREPLPALPEIVDDVEQIMEDLLINPQIQDSFSNKSFLEMDEDQVERIQSQIVQNKGLESVDEIVEKNQILEERIAKEVEDIQQLIDEIDQETKQPQPMQDFYVPTIQNYDVPIYQTAKETVIKFDDLDRKLDQETYMEIENEAEYQVLQQLEQKIYQAELAQEEDQETEENTDSDVEIQEQPVVPALEIELSQAKNAEEIKDSKEFLGQATPQINTQDQVNFDIQQVVVITAILSFILVIFLQRQASQNEQQRNSRDDNL